MVKSKQEAIDSSLVYFKGDQLAADTFVNKYAMVDADGNYESTPDEMHRRMAREYARIEAKYGKEHEMSEDGIYGLFRGFRYVVPGGSVMNGLGNPTYNGSLSNCFVIGAPEDSYGSIMKYRDYQVQLSKRRGGIGLDLSKLRPDGTKVNNAARTSTGPVSFMGGFSCMTNEVGQFGRRGALMISISGRHPDVMEFIESKQDLTKITGANISVKFNDDFFEAVKVDGDYLLRWPIDTDITDVVMEDIPYGRKFWDADNKRCYKKVRAKEVWDLFVHCAWATAEPGVMYEDKHYDLSPDSVYEQYKGVTTNPCLTGDMEVAVADGRGYVTIKELAEKGEDVLVYCLDDEGELTVSLMRNPRITAYDQDIYQVTLENGHVLKCTDNHKILINDRGYVEAKDLKVGDSVYLMTKKQCGTEQYCIATSKRPDEFKNEQQYVDFSDTKNGGSKQRANAEVGGTDNSGGSAETYHLYLKALENDETAFIKDGKVYVVRHCENCGQAFEVEYAYREQSFCSCECANAYENRSKASEAARTVKTEGYKIIGIEKTGKETVYNGTVDKYHNFFVGKFEERLADGNPKFLSINNLNCGEIFMGRYDSCRLMHINLSSFVDRAGIFDYDALEKVAYQNMYLCDDLIDLELEHVSAIIDHVRKGYIEDDRNELELWEKVYDTGSSSRRAGCGATGLADAVALMGIRLNSEEGFKTVRKIFRTKMLGELKAQVDLASERGTFGGYEFGKEYETLADGTLRGKNPFFQRLYEEYGETNPELFEGMMKYGRRNVSWSTMAPVGTGAIMTQGTSGVEPLFTPYGKRRKKCMSSSDRVDYVDNVGEKFTVYNTVHRPLLKWIMENCEDYDKTMTFDEQVTDEKKDKWFKASPWYGCVSNDLTPDDHIKLQSTVQYYVTHSLSKTCNLPSSATEQEISEIYFKAWEQDCKGVTVYRDGCRSGVILKDDKKDDNVNKPVTTLTHSAPKRPKSLPCEIKRFRNGGDKWIACVGLYNGEPYEIFTGMAEKLNLPEYVEKCVIIKNKADKMVHNDETGTDELMKVSSYDIVYNDKDGNIAMIEDVSSIFRSEFYAIAKLTSGLLRHGMPIENIISTIKSIDFRNETINSWKQGVIRTLKKYVKDDDAAPTGEKCPICGAKVIRENGCKHCSECDWSACQ